jgi:hypothetical protein
MASSINASTSGAGGLITTADNTGILQLQSGGTTIATISSTGLQQNVGAPAFSAYSSASQSTSSNVFLKVACGTEEWDTNSNYDNTTNYRFTPTVAGYYQVNCFIALNAATTRLIASIYKNGSQIKKVFDLGDVAAVANGGGSAIVYCNGSTDYLELYARTANANSVISSGGETMFQAALIRSA